STACDFTVTQNGTAATATALTVQPINYSPTTNALGFYSSDASGGSTIAKHTVPAGQTFVLDMMKNGPVVLGRSAGSNLTVTTSSISGTARIQIYWRESQ